MTTLREAAQHGQWDADSREGRKLITTLRQALEAKLREKNGGGA